LTASPHHFTTAELLLSVGTHSRVLDDKAKLGIFTTNTILVIKIFNSLKNICFEYD